MVELVGLILVDVGVDAVVLEVDCGLVVGTDVPVVTVVLAVVPVVGVVV